MRGCWIWGGCEFFPFWGTGLGEGTEMNADFGGRRYAWNRQLSVSVEIPLLWVVLLTWFLGRLSGVGSWRVGLCWDLRCRRQMGICWGIWIHSGTRGRYIMGSIIWQRHCVDEKRS